MMPTESSEAATSLFTAGELAFLKTQSLCRMATANAKGQPHVTPVSFHFDEATNTFVIGGGHGFATRKRWRDVQQNPQVAIVFDGILSTNPWKVAGIEIRGTAQTKLTGGEVLGPNFDPECFVITPKRIISWGIEGAAYGPANARTVG
jgi:PPOX class F420-dependent enzyme/OxyR family protein